MSQFSNQLQLFNWALEPAEDEVLDKLYELGYLDAAVWADQNQVELIVKNEQPLRVTDWEDTNKKTLSSWT